MKNILRRGALAAAVSLLGAACAPYEPRSNVNRDGGARIDAAGAPAGALYQRLGGDNGIRTVVTDFVNRVVKDPKINGYFLNSTVSGARVIDCLVLQVGSLTGSGQAYPGMSGCREMKPLHAGLKISMQDFNDTAGHLLAALNAAGVGPADVNTILGAVGATAPDIVEDPANNATTYQRVGRKPAIGTVVDMFIAKVAADPRINGFFGGTDTARLKTCLVRQVCNIDGPCKYGEEVTIDSEPGVGPAAPCKDMRSLHAGLKLGGAAGRGISKADFDALVEGLVAVLDGAGVPAADKNAILGALGPQCDDIVAGGVGCPGRRVVALTSANALLVFDSKTPGTATAPVPVTGLAQGETLHGITFRPRNNQLIGLGSSSRLYTINPATGAATAIGPGPFTPALAGTVFGFDFNPTVDRIRVVSDTGQNLRMHPDTGAVAGTDANINPAGLSVSAVAYTNSSLSASRVHHPLRHRRHRQQAGPTRRDQRNPLPQRRYPDRRRSARGGPDGSGRVRHRVPGRLELPLRGPDRRRDHLALLHLARHRGRHRAGPHQRRRRDQGARDPALTATAALEGGRAIGPATVQLQRPMKWLQPGLLPSTQAPP